MGNIGIEVYHVETVSCERFADLRGIRNEPSRGVSTWTSFLPSMAVLGDVRACWGFLVVDQNVCS